MTYRCETTLPDVDVIVDGYCIGTMPDFDCTFHLDDDGDLFEVEVLGTSDFGMRQQLFFVDRNSKGIEAAIWEAATLHFTENRWDIIDRAGVPSRPHEFADERLPQRAFV